MGADELRTLWTGRELKKATRGNWLADAPPDDWKQLRVSYDVRGLRPGNLVVCMAPSTWGGHVKDTSPKLRALANNGAVGAVVQRDQLSKIPALPKGFPVMVVRDTYQALKDMAKASRRRFKGTTVAVTGTVGKTTSREMLLHVGDAQGGATGTRANNNNIAGVARTMSYVPRDDGWAVIEMGFGRPKDGISISSKIVSPNVALLTSLSIGHLDMFTAAELAAEPAEKLILQCKMGIIDGMNGDGVAVMNADAPHFDIVRERCAAKKVKLVGFGKHEDAQSRLVSMELGPAGSKVRAIIGGREVEYELQVPGEHMASNSLGVLTCIHEGGGDLDQALVDIGTFKAVAGRSRILEIPLKKGKIHLIDDSFSATPASIRSTIRLLELAPVGDGGRRVAVLGEVGHMGSKEVEIHKQLGASVAQAKVDKVFTWGPLMKHLFEAVPPEVRGQHFDSVPELYAAVRAFLEPGDAVTVKSGRGTGGLGDKPFRAFVRSLKENRETMLAP